MKIAFFGDIHGQVYHLLAAVLTWQKRSDSALDMVIQVGDFGVEHLEKMIQNRDVFLRYIANNPAQFDFLRILYAQEHLAARLKEIRQQIQSPLYFVRGDHDDAAWLRQLSQNSREQTIPIDAFDLFHYIPDGTILNCGSVKLACFGGVEHPGRGKEGTEHDPTALTTLLASKSDKVDVLITHEPLYGCSTGFYGQTQGSTQVSKLIEALQPRYHVAGHLHTMIGPQQYGSTTSLGLNKLGGLSRPRQCETLPTLRQGTMALLDTATATLEFVTGDWLAGFNQECERIVESLASCLH
ncbi:metallophosphoesterase family protein [Dictyobacter aurantiacus]|uniref:Calcineurin-like phosphoesterase domain-containing protein n=1 Tax=Dictyobacter aurantiacus TaxID=1936993 RepID=A0A401ZNG0_9CHLR|nr:metallophosphoesterase [Dictyobacter aurantiacus]GCE08296.1 hypothetical protein KDAU_56250 [Dictyobacter aurantiacus]